MLRRDIHAYLTREWRWHV